LSVASGTEIIMILIALAGLTIGLCYVYLLSRHIVLGLISLLGAELFSIAFGINSEQLGSIHLDPLDAVSICLLGAGIIRTAQTLRTINTSRLVAVGYTALLAMSLGRGFYSNGVLAAANESRSFVGPLVAVLYFLTAPADDRSVRKYFWLYLSFGAGLCLIAILAAFGLPIGMTAWATADKTAIDGRYLPATGAAAIAVCGFISLAWLQYRKRGLGTQLVPMIFMSAAIYLRHRTVWMMMLAGMIALIPLDSRLFRRLLPAASVAAAAVAVLAFYGSSTQGLAGASQFSQSASNAQTLEWRLNGWKDLLWDGDQNVLTFAIGKSMGSGYLRIDPVSYQLVGVAPHSEYVQEYLRVGIVGIFLIVLLGLKPLLTLWKMTKIDPTLVYPSSSAWAIAVMVTLVYGLTYGIEPHAYALLGIANAIVLRLRAPEEEYVSAANEDWGMTVVPMTIE
jgi:hypothetical protein